MGRIKHFLHFIRYGSTFFRKGDTLSYKEHPNKPRMEIIGYNRNTYTYILCGETVYRVASKTILHKRFRLLRRKQKLEW